MSIFFNQLTDGTNTAQFFNGQANISTSTTSSPFTSLDGLTFAQRYPKTFGVYVKGKNHYEYTTTDKYANNRRIVCNLIDQASFQGWQLFTADITCDQGTGGGFTDKPTRVVQSLQDKWDGTSSGGTVISGNNPFGQGVSQTDRWFFIAAKFNSPSDITTYMIDPDNGNVLLTLQDTDLTTSTASTTSSTQFKMHGVFSTDTNTDRSDGFYVGEALLWDEGLSLSELQAFAQVGFGHINRPQNLILDWNFLLDWRGTNATDTIDDKSNSGATGTFGKAFGQVTTGWDNFSTDNPVPVFIPQIADNQHDVLNLSIFSGVAGECYFSVYAANATAPTEAEIVAGSGLTNGSVTLDGTSTLSTSVAQPDTGTDYIIYLVQDENDAGSYGPIVPIEYTSSTKYSEIITDIEGTETTNLTNIKYKWFDSTDLSALGSSTADGTTEVTDGTGLLEVTLPNGLATTAKGSQGTLMLQVDDGGTVKTAYHIVTVK